MRELEELKSIFEEFLSSVQLDEKPSNLYAPINYIMRIGGKRIRPILLLASSDLFTDQLGASLRAALGIEMFHNFTLVHDDIMDDAPLRRGEMTVHEKWDTSTAILSGDAMLIKSYEYFDHLEPELYKKVFSEFNACSIQLCEGQRMDMDFEVDKNVMIEDYLKMIEYKTAVLLACALKIGALIAGADQDDAEHLYKFGRNVGISFQIQDDLLDVFGDNPKVGKQKAGDILQNKKTYLYLKSLELLSEKKSQEIKSLYSEEDTTDAEEKIARVTALFKTAQVHIYSEELKEAYLNLALSHLDAVKVAPSKKDVLRRFANYLLVRKF